MPLNLVCIQVQNDEPKFDDQGFCQFWAFLFGCFFQFHRFLAVNIWFDRSVVSKQFKIHNIFIILPNSQLLIWFVLDHDIFWLRLLWTIGSHNSYQKRDDCLILKCVSQMLIFWVRWIIWKWRRENCYHRFSFISGWTLLFPQPDLQLQLPALTYAIIMHVLPWHINVSDIYNIFI